MATAPAIEMRLTRPASPPSLHPLPITPPASDAGTHTNYMHTCMEIRIFLNSTFQERSWNQQISTPMFPKHPKHLTIVSRDQHKLSTSTTTTTAAAAKIPRDTGTATYNQVTIQGNNPTNRYVLKPAHPVLPGQSVKLFNCVLSFSHVGAIPSSLYMPSLHYRARATVGHVPSPTPWGYAFFTRFLMWCLLFL